MIVPRTGSYIYIEYSYIYIYIWVFYIYIWACTRNNQCKVIVGVVLFFEANVYFNLFNLFIILGNIEYYFTVKLCYFMVYKKNYCNGGVERWRYRNLNIMFIDSFFSLFEHFSICLSYLVISKILKILYRISTFFSCISLMFKYFIW